MGAGHRSSLFQKNTIKIQILRIAMGGKFNGTLDAFAFDPVYLVYSVYRIERTCNGKVRATD